MFKHLFYLLIPTLCFGAGFAPVLDSSSFLTRTGGVVNGDLVVDPSSTYTNAYVKLTAAGGGADISGVLQLQHQNGSAMSMIVGSEGHVSINQDLIMQGGKSIKTIAGGGFYAYNASGDLSSYMDYLGLHVGTNSFVVDNGGNVTDSGNYNLAGNTISNGFFAGDGYGLTNLNLDAGVSSYPLNGSSALDWGVRNGSMSRRQTTYSGLYHSVLYGANDIFRYTDSVSLYSLTGGVIDVTYFGCFGDANEHSSVTSSVLTQISVDDFATWNAVTNEVIKRTNDSVTALSPITVPAGSSRLRYAVATNATPGEIQIYMIFPWGQL